jgi:hypothetical protein
MSSDRTTTADIAGRSPDEPNRDDREREEEPVDDGGERVDRSAEPDDDRGARAEASDRERAGGREALLDSDDTTRFRARWMEIQAVFVDEPRGAVEQADGLVAELMKHLAETFAREREGLEGQWTRGEDVSTEELRVALTRYRSFFDRLLEA